MAPFIRGDPWKGAERFNLFTFALGLMAKNGEALPPSVLVTFTEMPSAALAGRLSYHILGI